MIVAIISMAILALVMGIILAIASKKFFVKEDPNIEKVFEALPKNNCGACGFAGCLEFSKAIIKDPKIAGHCRVATKEEIEEISQIMGVEVEKEIPFYCRVYCKGGKNCSDKFEYSGVKSCSAASLLMHGQKSCSYACLGFGDCVSACQFGAITMNGNNIPVVDTAKCTGCGLCIKKCPKNILALTTKPDNTIIACSSHDGAKKVIESCKSGCIACGLCAKKCPQAAIEIKSNLAVVDFSKCVHCAICANVCPRKVIDIS